MGPKKKESQQRAKAASKQAKAKAENVVSRREKTMKVMKARKDDVSLLVNDFSEPGPLQ